MSLLHNITLLLGGYETKILRQQHEIFNLGNKLKNIQEKITTLSSQLQGMKSLLKNIQPQNKKLSRAEFFTLQRKQSVVRRRIANTVLEIGQQQLAMTNLKKEILQARELHKQLQRQTDKYRDLQMVERVKINRARASQEELDIEEMIAWRKS